MNWPEQGPGLPGRPQFYYPSPQVAYQYHIPQLQSISKEALEQRRQDRVSDVRNVLSQVVEDSAQKCAQSIQTTNDSLGQEVRDMKNVFTSNLALLSRGLRDCQGSVFSHLKDSREGRAVTDEQQQLTQHHVQRLADEIRQWRTDQDKLVRGLTDRVENNEKCLRVLNETVLKELQVLTSQKQAAQDEVTATLRMTQDKLSAVLVKQENMLRLFEPSDGKEHESKRKTRSQRKQDPGDELQNMPPVLRGAFQGAVRVLLGSMKDRSSTIIHDETAREGPKRVKEENEPKRKRQRRG